MSVREKGVEVLIREMTPTGYTLHSRFRLTGRGGGIAVVCSLSHLQVKFFTKTVWDSFESMEFSVTQAKHHVRFLCVYAPQLTKIIILL